MCLDTNGWGYLSGHSSAQSLLAGRPIVIGFFVSTNACARIPAEEVQTDSLSQSPVAFRFQRSRGGNGAGRKRSRRCQSQPLPRVEARRSQDRRRDTELPAKRLRNEASG